MNCQDLDTSPSPVPTQVWAFDFPSEKRKKEKLILLRGNFFPSASHVIKKGNLDVCVCAADGETDLIRKAIEENWHQENIDSDFVPDENAWNFSFSLFTASSFFPPIFIPIHPTLKTPPFLCLYIFRIAFFAFDPYWWWPGVPTQRMKKEQL